MKIKNLLPLLALPILSSCELYTHKGPFPAYSKETLIPHTFLYTEYAPLNAWLDTPVRVQIFDTPLMETFGHPSLRGLNYKIIQPHKINPKVTIDAIALTRRQLLWTLAHDHEMTITPVFGAPGQPACIEIRAK